MRGTQRRGEEDKRDGIGQTGENAISARSRIIRSKPLDPFLFVRAQMIFTGDDAGIVH